MTTITITITEIALGAQPRPFSLTLALTRPIPQGHFLRLRADGVNGMRAFRVRAVRIEGEELTLAQHFDAEEMQRQWLFFMRHKPVAAIRAPRDLEEGAAITFRGEIKPGGQDAGLSLGYALVTAAALDDADWLPASADYSVRVVPGEAESLHAWRLHGGRLAVAHFDRFCNAVAAPGEIVIEDGVARRQDGSAATILPAPPEPPRLRVRDAAGRETLSSPPPLGLHDEPVYFGEFHWHCDFSSDGQRPLEDAMSGARDEVCLDFAGPADHLLWKNSYGRRTIEEQAANCRAFDVPDRFVSLPTFELSAREGHANIIADSWELLAEIAEACGAARLGELAERERRYPVEELAALCPEGHAVLVPHHTNMDSWVRERVTRPDGRPFWCAFAWGSRAERRATRLIEIHQGRGSFEDETPDERWRIDAGGFGASARTALARGFRLGFTGGTDNHAGLPARNHGRWCGYTGVVAPRLDLPSVFHALYARRCYATTGARIVADWRMNDVPMGGEAVLEPADPREFEIMLRGTAPWQSVEIISCGAILHAFDVPPDTLDLRMRWADERPGRPLRDGYYYIRARQSDGHCAWLSPIWADLP